MRCIVLLLSAIVTACVPQLDDCTDDLDCPRDRFCSGGYCLPPDGGGVDLGGPDQAPGDMRIVDGSIRDQRVDGQVADLGGDWRVVDLAVPDLAVPDLAVDARIDPDSGGGGCPQVEGVTAGATCYTGPAGTAEAGRPCQQGIWTCEGDAWICAGQVLPGAEDAALCNGVDDDCDGTVDEVPRVACAAGVGACQVMGVQACVGGQLECDAQPAVPGDEACINALDDDCDGSVDEGCECEDGRPPVECGSDVGACVAGTQACEEGRLLACEGAIEPGNEVCDAIDNDCDGQLDEGFALGGQCVIGAGECRRSGVTVCLDAQRTGCNAEVIAPVAERCNGLDDDCDGSADELLGVGARCRGGVGECAFDGTLECTDDGGTRCAGNAPPAGIEICNGRDDDCDGTVDEDTGGMPCDTGVGRCAREGAIVCVEGRPMCRAMEDVEPEFETCNGIDDDCDGLVDDAVAGLTPLGDPLNAGTWGEVEPAVLDVARSANRTLVLTHVQGEPPVLEALIANNDEEQFVGRRALAGLTGHWAAARLGAGFVVAGTGGDVRGPTLEVRPVGANGDFLLPGSTAIPEVDHLELMDIDGADPVALVHPVGTQTILRVRFSEVAVPITEIDLADYVGAGGFGAAIDQADTHLVFSKPQGLSYALARDANVVDGGLVRIPGGDFGVLVRFDGGVVVAGRAPNGSGGFDFRLRQVDVAESAMIEGVAGLRPSMVAAAGHLLVGWRDAQTGEARIALYDGSLRALHRVDLGPATVGPVVASQGAQAAVAWIDTDRVIRVQHFDFNCPRIP